MEVFDILNGMDNFRTHQILAYLKLRKSCSLAELMEKFNVSSATIHRDVEALTKRDAVERVRGGLIYNGTPESHGNSSAFQERVVANRRQKIAAATKALEKIDEGDIVFLDSSTTVYELALLLTRADIDHLTVITNAVAVMNLFRKFPPHWSMIALGGNYDPQLNSILGDAAIEQLSRFNLTKAFVSCFGIDDKNTTTNHERQAGILKRVLAAADKRYLLADRTKIGRKGIYLISPRGGFNAVFTG